MLQRLQSLFGKPLSSLFNTRAAGLYMLLFAAAIGVATFIENDFGTSAAQKVVFKAWWFELLLVLFGISVLVNIIRFRMVQRKKWALLIFHLAIVIILTGAGITRYFGYEGVMHIREQAASDRFLSSDTYLSFQAATEGSRFSFSEPVLFASIGNNHWQQRYQLGDQEVAVRVKDFIPNPVQVLQKDEQGKPVLKLVVAGASGRETYMLEQGQTRQVRETLFNFREEPLAGAFNLRYDRDSLFFQYDKPLVQTVMATQTRDTLLPSPRFQSLRLRALYSSETFNVVFPEFEQRGVVVIQSEDPKVKGESLTALLLEVQANGQSRETYVYGRKGSLGRTSSLTLGNLQLGIRYGSAEIQLPFQIRLYDFIMDRYPGTNSAASYASEVQLVDPRHGVNMDYRIYMNNILNYDGYRFFQSSFDKDEKGTYLSVNHDFWGTTITYLGYFLLALGMLLTLVSKNTRFYQVRRSLRNLRVRHAGIGLFLLASGAGLFAKNQNVPAEAVSKAHAEVFSKVVVQDFRGRMKPVHTLSREILRKVSRSEEFAGLSADQVLLGMFANPRDWYEVSMIKLGRHPYIEEKLGLTGKYAAYKDFFHADGSYRLEGEMRRIEGLAPGDRGVYEKELLKMDERVNIMNMVFSGAIFRLIPLEGDPNHTWVSSRQHGRGGNGEFGSAIAEKFFPAYRDALQEGMESQNFQRADQLITELTAYQKEKGAAVFPTSGIIRGEILLNQSRVFNRLTGVYLLLGLGFLVLLFLSVFRPDSPFRTAYRVLFGLLCLGFAFHTLGLGLRWYVSGRAPWSNGYESMIYIGWTTMLAGLLFTRKSFGGLAATSVLAATILFVASLSFLDPEITPLVPVLRSYWLTIHVSLEAGSYGFLMLGAIIGLINMSLMAVMRASNKSRIKTMVREMSYISEMTLTSGLVMISIGTFLGGVWANESWGRYWGWDAKETWALVTILVYAFILHMRIIPRLFGLYAYNLATIFGLASVIMTYYGVNYYLSGLHSYATGDPVPIPSWVYVFSGFALGISLLAYYKKRKHLT